MFDHVTCYIIVWQIYVVVFKVQSESKQVRSQRLLTLLNCSEFKDDSAVSLEASGSKSLHYMFCSGKFTLPSLTIVM